MSKSILSNRRECLICGNVSGLHRHHVFYGTANRRKSEADGCWCYLCVRHHNGSENSVHYNKIMDRNLKKDCQRRWEKIYGSREDFIHRYGKSYLEE